MPSFHVSGPATLSYGGTVLGWGEHGVDIDIQQSHFDVIVDYYGPNVPAEVQAMLQTATISTNLVSFEWSVLNNALSQTQAGAAAGVMPAAGKLLGANGNFKPLVIASSMDNVPWTFPSTYLISMGPTIGTVRTIIPIVFRALPYSANSDTSAGAVLYTH